MKPKHHGRTDDMQSHKFITALCALTTLSN